MLHKKKMKNIGFISFRFAGTDGVSLETYKWTEVLQRMGYDPLPIHREPLESPISTPDLFKEYPLILTTGARTLEYLHSQLRDVPRLRKRLREPLAEVHPDTAARYGVSDGDMVSVETKRGSIEIMQQP